MSPRLQDAITSPEGLIIAGMTATSLALIILLINAVTTWRERKQRRKNEAEIEAAARLRSRDERAAGWTP